MSHPLPFMKASTVFAPKKGATREKPDLEEAIEESEEEMEMLEGAKGEEEEEEGGDEEGEEGGEVVGLTFQRYGMEAAVSDNVAYRLGREGQGASCAPSVGARTVEYLVKDLHR